MPETKESKFRLVDLAELVNLDRQLAGEGLDLSGADRVTRTKVRRMIATAAQAFPGKEAAPYAPDGVRVPGEIRWFWTDGAALFAVNAGKLRRPKTFAPCPDRGPSPVQEKASKALKTAVKRYGTAVQAAHAKRKAKAGK